MLEYEFTADPTEQPMKKPVKTPWLKISAEGVAIVVSILLAFAIDAWWSGRVERQLVDENLAALRAELQSNLDEVQHELRFRSAVIDAVEALFALLEAEEPLDEATIDDLLERLTWSGRIDISTGALASILDSGVLASIDNGPLKRSIAALPYLYESTSTHERSTTDFLNTELLLHMNRHGSILQIYNANLGQGRPGGGAEMSSDSRLPERQRAAHSELLESREFLGLLAIAQGRHENVSLYYTRLEAAMERSIELIDERLD